MINFAGPVTHLIYNVIVCCNCNRKIYAYSVYSYVIIPHTFSVHTWHCIFRAFEF